MYLAYAVGNIIGTFSHCPIPRLTSFRILLFANVPAGPQTFIANQAPEYVGGITAMLVSYCVCIVLAIILGASYYMENKKRTANAGAVEAEGSAFLDMTDKENKMFTYII